MPRIDYSAQNAALYPPDISGSVLQSSYWPGEWLWPPSYPDWLTCAPKFPIARNSYDWRRLFEMVSSHRPDFSSINQRTLTAMLPFTRMGCAF